jgi:hypothetical protein
MPTKKISGLALALLALTALAYCAGAQEQPPAASDFEITIPSGTIIPIVLTAYLNTKSSKVGDVVYADTSYPVWIQQKLAIPKGSTIRATLAEVIRPGRIKGGGQISVKFNDILLPNGVKREIVATFRGIHGSGDETYSKKNETVTGGTSKADDVGTITGGLGTGAAAGAVITRSGTGAGIGGLAGAAGGVAAVLLTRGKDLVLAPGTQFDLELLKPLTFTFGELEFSDSELNNARREVRSVPQPSQNNSPFKNRKLFPGVF